MYDIVVVGSLNKDIVVESESFPRVGETIIGSNLSFFSGGKGANQGVAASRMEVSTCLLGKVGADTFGETLLADLAIESLSVEHVSIENGQPTGIALITQATGDNTIVVIPGANASMDIDFVKSKSHVIAEAKVLLGQMEIPFESLRVAFELAKKSGTLTILNPAPYNQKVQSLLHDVDYLTPNETEFFELVANFREPGDFEEDLLFLNQILKTKIIVTRGERGVSLIEKNKVVTIPAINIQVKDTTGAGDTFNGILASYLAQQFPLIEAVKAASVGASLAVEVAGAQSGMPTKKELTLKLETLT